jgi:hypothetical protein
MTLMFIVKVDSAMILIIAGNGKYNKRSLPKAAMICYTVLPPVFLFLFLIPSRMDYFQI